MTRPKMSDAEKAAYMRRMFEPDGICFHCGQPANRRHPFCGPLRVRISDDGETLFGATLKLEFCSWTCHAHWAAEQDGGEFVGEEPEEDITGEEQGARS